MVAKKTGSSGEALPVRVVTFNVRYAAPRPMPNEKSWQVRCPKICTQLDFITRGHDSPFLCLQEVLYPQLLDIQAGLGEGWGYVGIGRDDGDRLGELSPVFYRVDTWKCEVFKNYWLSETPDRPSKGWDAALPRIVTVGEFVHKRTGQRAVVMSTHFDHLGVVAREQSAKLILRIAAQWAEERASSPPAAVILGGDFNSNPSDNAYKSMVAKGSGMADAHALVPAEKRYGNELTYTSFDEPDQQAVRIDFIFVKVPSDVKVTTFGVLTNRFDDGVFLSDHRPVVADLEVRAAKGSSASS
ncbi:hypothetical protein HYQ45_001976 [Verticillium longisporum]|uniref:Endonuclease/exonuclease/phosphatase family protein n=3 Tax=Verticillium TaxID=1036719 RepID=G2X3U7_VERDV|nr:endonuclease/exonuclease/phosphatase family protein [Verticillium dahliae VdLs.17]KAF3345072.1 hypothetical protein VdG2_06685 [Verticillium dahliae VDG2]KAF3356991.1 hypothetical protein VdG1_03549 [Verticillium dahliae VDG1]KAG7141414.1 hypothetical protein HYQ45_001976 [Verticillium longisporum]KAH6662464.1 endonuclease/exonuclease/phosphatase family protein [Verticillium dahliae]EGY23246.1 endonuclease/exonuclease/phosphatase family protein [Verticillium dahliae VdLs.17]